MVWHLGTLVRSELRSGINTILRIITYLIIPVGIGTIINQLYIQGLPLPDAIRGMVAALVPMVPEGLVLLTSIAFAVGVIRLGRRQCLVQELPAIEGLARVDIVCADKTGTLTENGMRLAELRPVNGYRPAEIASVLSGLAATDPRPNASLAAILETHPVAATGGHQRDHALLLGAEVERCELPGPRPLGARRPGRAAPRRRLGTKRGRADRREGAAGAAAGPLHDVGGRAPARRGPCSRRRWWCSSSGSARRRRARCATSPSRTSRSR